MKKVFPKFNVYKKLPSHFVEITSTGRTRKRAPLTYSNLSNHQ